MALAEAPPDPEPGSRAPERWRPRGADAPAQLRSWTDILAETHLAFDLRPTFATPSRFQAAVTRRSIGDLMLVDCAAAPFLGRRSRTVIGTPPAAKHERALGCQLVCKGVELGREGSRELALTPGDVVLWDGLAPTEIEI